MVRLGDVDYSVTYLLMKKELRGVEELQDIFDQPNLCLCNRTCSLIGKMKKYITDCDLTLIVPGTECIHHVCGLIHYV